MIWFIYKMCVWHMCTFVSKNLAAKGVNIKRYSRYVKIFNIKSGADYKYYKAKIKQNLQGIKAMARHQLSVETYVKSDYLTN